MESRITHQQSYLSGVSLMRRTWHAPVQPSDHDHCAFCRVKFAAPAIRGAIQAGYATVDDQHWICDDCFHDFRGAFGWSVV